MHTWKRWLLLCILLAQKGLACSFRTVRQLLSRSPEVDRCGSTSPVISMERGHLLKNQEKPHPEIPNLMKTVSQGDRKQEKPFHVLCGTQLPYFIFPFPPLHICVLAPQHMEPGIYQMLRAQADLGKIFPGRQTARGKPPASMSGWRNAIETDMAGAGKIKK